jgi:Xaa-Pro dipeptidase
MVRIQRRAFVASSLAGIASLGRAQESVPAGIRNLKPMLDGVQPITDEERRGRIAKAQRLMSEQKIGALVLEPGASMFYFTGTRWSANDPALLLTIPAKGNLVWVAPKSSAAAQKNIRMGGDIRPWTDAEGPYKLLAQAMGGRSRIAIEEKARFAVFDNLRRELPAAEFVSGDPITVACRVIKSPAEIALMQRANDITIAVYKAVVPTLHEGMDQRELSANIAAGYRAAGTSGDALVIFGKYTAFPHGSVQPQKLREGDMVLIDDGCSVDGYQSDITRTTVFGKPTARQREVWNLERKAQDAALAAARPGATCESVDAAARKVITDAGFGPGYRVPGLPHRTGHGIGLEGHEWTNLVKGNKTKIEPGMCFSNEPTIAIYGEFGVRLEDCMHITPEGARMFTPQSPAIDQPFG